MRMSELVSSMGLTLFPIIGLVCFGIAFLFILYRVARTRSAEAIKNASLPLNDGTITSKHTIAQQTGGGA